MYSPAQARRLLPTMATVTGAEDQTSVRTYKSVEIRSGNDSRTCYLQLEAKLSTLQELARLLPMRNDFQEVLKNASDNYMPCTKYDANNSSFRRFAGDYGCLRHVMEITTKSSDVKYYSRVHLVDLLLADGWEPLGFSSHYTGLRDGNWTIPETVETWIKREKQYATK